MGYFGPYFMILVQPTSKVVFNALKSVTTFDLISYDHQSPYVTHQDPKNEAKTAFIRASLSHSSLVLQVIYQCRVIIIII